MQEIDFLSPQNQKIYTADDIGISRLFIDCFSDDLIFCADAGAWYVWNGRCWEQDARDGGQANEMLKQLATYCINTIMTNDKISSETQSELLKKYSKLLTKGYRDTILRDAMSIRPVKSSQFNTYKYLFNCTNGTYDFERGHFRDFERKDFLTDMSNVYYDANADCPRFKKYLDEVMYKDKSKIDYLLKIAAYCLTGDTSQECFFIIYGDKTRNGKGTFVSTLAYLLGTYATTLKASSITRKTLNGGGSNASPDLAKLKNVRLANVNEIEDNTMLDVALIKEITGGDTMTARFLYKEEFTFVPQFKILINTNILPKMSEDSIFRSDRLHILNFDHHFAREERDLQLKEKLKKEVSGIFNLLVKYYAKLQKDGFKIPQESAQTLEQYQYNSNNVLLYIKEMLYHRPGTYEALSDVYRQYADWCSDNGYNSLSKKNFKERLQKCNITIEEGLIRHTNSLGISSVQRGWIKDYALTPPKDTQITLTELKNAQDLPF